jgi:acylaminoacyl-peptidase
VELLGGSVLSNVHEVLPVIQEPRTTGPTVAGMGFPGLFLGQLPQKCCIADNYLVTSTVWGSVIKVVRVDLTDGSLALIDLQVQDEEEEDASLKSHSILCFTPNGGIVVAESGSNLPARTLYVPPESLVQDPPQHGSILGKAKPIGTFSSIAATSFSSVGPKDSAKCSYEVVTIASPEIDGAVDVPVQSILMLPKSSSSETARKFPLIVIPHGGPHSCSIVGYVPGVAYLCGAGNYAILLTNYRGSIGFGQSSIESLLTRVGDLDVQDVMAACRQVAQMDCIDETKIGICGGSHGGFLTGHCTGQYPDFFKAAVMRNPVTNIASMVTATDIPDW